MGRGGRSTLPINLRLSREDCSQGKYSLHRVTQGRLLILPSTPGDTSEPIAAECELCFSRTLKRGGCFLPAN